MSKLMTRKLSIGFKNDGVRICREKNSKEVKIIMIFVMGC